MSFIGQDIFKSRSQLAGIFDVAVLTIQDRPRLPWPGVLVDVFAFLANGPISHPQLNQVQAGGAYHDRVVAVVLTDGREMTGVLFGLP